MNRRGPMHPMVTIGPRALNKTPVCRRLNLDNGRVFQDYEVGSIASFQCDGNYVLNGSKLRLCLLDGTWTVSNPKCISKYLI